MAIKDVVFWLMLGLPLVVLLLVAVHKSGRVHETVTLLWGDQPNGPTYVVTALLVLPFVTTAMVMAFPIRIAMEIWTSLSDETRFMAVAIPSMGVLGFLFFKYAVPWLDAHEGLVGKALLIAAGLVVMGVVAFIVRPPKRNDATHVATEPLREVTPRAIFEDVQPRTESKGSWLVEPPIRRPMAEPRSSEKADDGWLSDQRKWEALTSSAPGRRRESS